MKKIVKFLTVGAALTLLASCENPLKKFTGNTDEPSGEQQQQPDTPVEVKVSGVSLNKTETSLFLTQSEYLTATVSPENATNKLLSWTSDNEDVAVVNASGKVSGLGVGDAIIRATSQADSTKYAQCVVHVSIEDKTVHVSSVSIAESSFALDLGGTDTAQPTLTVLPENATDKSVTWSSSDPSKVMVDSATGVIKALAVTTEPVTVTATSVDNSSKKASVPVTVVDTRDHSIHVESVSLPATLALDLKAGGNGVLTASVTPSNAGDKRMTWTVSEENVLEINEFGENSITIKALKTTDAEGVKVRATSKDNTEAFAECTVTVVDRTVYATGVSIKVNGAEKDSTNVELEHTIYLNASVLPPEADDRDIVWEMAEGGKEFLTLSNTSGESISVYGKKATETPVVLTAKAKADPSKFKNISISVIDRTQGSQFMSFVDPADYAEYKLHIEDDNLNDITGLGENASLPVGNFFKYDVGDEDLALYKVGDQGVFRFAPSAKLVLKGDSFPTEVPNIQTTKKLYELTDLETDVFNTYAQVAENGIDYTFNQSAAGKKFRLVLEPDYTKYYSATTKTYQFDFEVISGYNVDSLAELSLFDNIQNSADKWGDYKTEKGLTTEAKGGIVLHKDIVINSDLRIPSAFIEDEDSLAAFKASKPEEYGVWKSFFNNDEDAADARFVGSLKDGTVIFNRDTREDDFRFEGNFFSIDYSSLKTIADLSGGFVGEHADGAHAELFGINACDAGLCPEFNNQAPKTEQEHHNVVMRNLALKGNGGLKEDSPFEKGGLIGFKLDSAHFEIQNSIVSSTFTAFMTFDDEDHGLTSMTADRVIGYDCYNSAFYVHGTPDNILTNSWMSKAGGPLVILDECSDHQPKHHLANMDCRNCYMHNYVRGTEPWFDGHEGATDMAQNYIITPGQAMTNPLDTDEQAAHWYYASALGYQKTMYEAYSTVVNPRTIASQVYSALEDSEYYCDLIAIDIDARKLLDNRTNNLRGHFILDNDVTLESPKAVNLQMSTVQRADSSPYYPCAFPGWSSPAEAILFSSATGGSMRLDATPGHETVKFNEDAPTTTYNHFTSEYVNMFLNPLAKDTTLMNGKYFGVVLGTFPM